MYIYILLKANNLNNHTVKIILVKTCKSVEINWLYYFLEN